MFSLEALGLSVVLSWAAGIPGKVKAGMDKGLTQAAAFWLSQHKARWIKQESPEGDRWAPNNRMWAEIKGNSTPLTGITQGTTRTWQGIKFIGNSIHMRSALQKKVYTNKIEFFYPDTVKDRALATQEGRMGSILIGYEGSTERRFIFNIPARPHTGIGPDDQKGIEEQFSKEIGDALL